VANDLELSTPAYVVLGMVGLGARSGYEIKRTVDLSIRFFWTISQAQIYPSLGQLEAAGYITGRDEPLGRRPRRVFEITPEGERALRVWPESAGELPFELRDIGMVKLFFADALDPGPARALLGAVRRRSDERAALLRSIRPTAEGAEEEGNVFPGLTLEMGIAFHEAMVDACDAFERRISREG
jgi:DNA-binding PadR family transcriptional regulator